MERRSTFPPTPFVLKALSLLAPSASVACGPAGLSEPPDSALEAPNLEIPRAAPVPSGFELVQADELFVSAGRLDVDPRDPRATDLHVNAGGMRAEVRGDDGDAAELSFVFKGASDETTPLANGETRRQIGLKLRAQDTCNLVYVMWHESPTPGIHVSVKHNVGKTTHAECGDHGYVNLQPMRTQPPPIAIGERHRLRAEIEGTTLRVHADEVLIWEGPLPSMALTLVGPAGVRSDNGMFDFELSVHSRRTKDRRSR
jgi:hypothetical protein